MFYDYQTQFINKWRLYKFFNFSVAIVKELHGKGIGKNMMLDAEKWAKAKGFDSAYLWSYTRTEDFYIKCGYKKKIWWIWRNIDKGILK